MQPSQIAKFVENNPKYVLHEVIHNEYNKLYFDIDDAEIDLFDFEEKVQTQMARLNLPADIKMFVA